jgi:D-glycero-alpha-D-manno-heptose-7-phosphate kinase
LISKKALATQAIQVEQDLSGEHVGSQDQTAVSFGGFNRIDFLQNGEILVTPVTISPEKLNRLKDSLLLCFTGFSRIASNVAREKIRRIPSNLTELKVMHGMVDEAMKILGGPENSLDDFGKLLHESWQLKRGLASNVSNKVIDEIYDKARAEGALGGKICGAGDGGFMLLFAPKDRHPCIRKALSKFLFVPFQFEFLGSHIIFNTNQEDPWGDASGQLTSPCAPMVL